MCDSKVTSKTHVQGMLTSINEETENDPEEEEGSHTTDDCEVNESEKKRREKERNKKMPEMSKLSSNESLYNQRSVIEMITKALLRIKELVVKLLKHVVFNSDVLHIIRPFIYVALVAKHGKRSWYPIWISLAIDLFIIFLVFLKLIGPQKLRTIERRDLTRRNIISLLKYLLRDPIFDNFTLKIIKKVFVFCRIPNFLFGILLSILNYQRYYTYIA